MAIEECDDIPYKKVQNVLAISKADNLSWLRRFAISLLKHHPSKHSIKGKSQIAGWSNEFLMQVLTAKGV